MSISYYMSGTSSFCMSSINEEMNSGAMGWGAGLAVGQPHHNRVAIDVVLKLTAARRENVLAQINQDIERQNRARYGTV